MFDSRSVHTPPKSFEQEVYRLFPVPSPEGFLFYFTPQSPFAFQWHYRLAWGEMFFVFFKRRYCVKEVEILNYAI